MSPEPDIRPELVPRHATTSPWDIILSSLFQSFPVTWKLVKKANLNLSSTMVRPGVGENAKSHVKAREG